MRLRFCRFAIWIEIGRNSLSQVEQHSVLPQTPMPNAEEFYYLKQMAARTPMVVVLTDGEELRGWIEWYDKNALKINRHREPNLLIPKRNIRYMYKEEELRRRRRRASAG